MTGGDGEEGAGIIVEADSVVKARCLSRHLAEAAHAFGAVIKPPRGAELHRGIMASKRREFAGIAGFVQREDDQAEIWVVAVFGQQRAERVDIFAGQGDVCALVAPELFENRQGCGCDKRRDGAA